MDQWEDVLSMLAPSNLTARDGRTGLTDPKVEWIGGHNVEITNGIKGADLGGQAFDSWYSWNFSFTSGSTSHTGSVAVGLTLKWEDFLAETTPWGKFLRDGPRVLYPLWAAKANDRVSVASFEDAATMLEQVTYFLDGWIPVTRKWATDVDAPDGDWQGSAAGSFRAVLTAYSRELETLRGRLADAGVAASLRENGKVVRDALGPLVTAWESWRGSKAHSPLNALANALYEGLVGAKVQLKYSSSTSDLMDFWDKSGEGLKEGPSQASGFSVTFSGAKFGDPYKDEFWVAVKERAKAIWEGNLAPLDAAAKKAMQDLETSFNKTRTLMERHPVGSPTLRMPMATPPKTDVGDPDKDPTKDITDKIDKDLTGGGGPGTKDLGGGGGGPEIKNLGTGGGGTGDGLTLGGGTGSGGSGSTGGGTGGLDLIGGGLNGGGSLGDGSLLGGGSGSNKPVTVPTGSRITEDGRVVDANGKPVLDANGNPMVVGKDYTIGPDGTLRDGQGSPVPQYRQLLADSYAGGGGGDDLLTPSNFGSGGFAYGTSGLGAGLSGSGSGGLIGTGGLPGITGMGGGLSSRSLANGGDPVAVKAAVEQANAERLAAEKAARAAAQEQSLLTGRQTTTSSGGMPPMMPPGGGMGAPGGQGEKDRRRTTWLAEDEEVWGTETGAVHGVIGR